MSAYRLPVSAIMPRLVVQTSQISTPTYLTSNEPLSFEEDSEIRALINCATNELKECANSDSRRAEELNDLIRRNFAILSKVRLIPNELWTEIFEWYGAKWCTFRAAAPSAGACVLGLVCRRWRNLALSMPQLWNNPPVVHINPRSLEGSHFTERWRELLRRSGRLPLKLHFAFDIPVYEVSAKPYQILAPFFGRATRWEHITISGLMVMQTEVHFGPIRGKLDLLHSVTFNFVPTTFDFIPSEVFSIFEDAPSLTKILLHSPSPSLWKSRLRFPWSQLTNYQETGIDMGTFPVVLELSPAMESLQYGGENFVYHFIDPIFHTKLRHLSVEASSVVSFWRQLGQLTLPSLETFLAILREGFDSRNHRRLPSISTAIDLVVRSKCPLRRLVLNFGSATIGPELVRLFPHTPDLETLELGSCHGSFSASVLHKLVFNKDRVTSLPRLRSLTLIYPNHLKSPIAALISEIALSREKSVADDSSPGQLYNTLKHVRVVSADTDSRYYAMCELGGWEDPLLTLYDTPPSWASSSDSELRHHIRLLTGWAVEAYPFTDDVPPPELMSLFCLAYLIDDARLRKRTLHDLGKMDILSSIQSRMAEGRWIIGCKSDILYIHPDHDIITMSEIWEVISMADINRLNSLLGYQLVKEPKNDLIGANDSLEEISPPAAMPFAIIP